MFSEAGGEGVEGLGGVRSTIILVGWNEIFPFAVFLLCSLGYRSSKKKGKIG